MDLLHQGIFIVLCPKNDKYTGGGIFLTLKYI